MKIFITIPDFSVHGGIRIIMEWANRLTQWHEVWLHSLKGGQPGWFDLDPRVHLVSLSALRGADLMIVTSPHSIHLVEHMECPPKVVLFAQMAEHLFRPNDKQWAQRCSEFYLSRYPMVSISRWNIEMMTELGRTGKTFHVGNGVNLQHFPLESPDKDFKTILVEGWEAGNASKDAGHVAPVVAERLKKRGYRIVAYSQKPLQTMKHVPHEYYHCPDLGTLNDLYRRATLLLKASRFDARSCAPVEAMTKKTPTVRAIGLGDDDVLHEYNGIRVGYNANEMYQATTALLANPDLYLQLADNCHKHIRRNGWDTWMPIINDIICSA